MHIDIQEYTTKNDLFYQPFVHLDVMKHFILSLIFLSYSNLNIFDEE